MRLLHLVTAALLATASGAVVTPGHAATPPLSARGVLGAETTITWSGNAAIRLAVPKKTYYRDGDVDLWVSGATYAFVRFVGPAHRDCPGHIGPRCLQDRVNWIRGMHDNPAHDSQPVSRRHDAYFAIPAVIDGPTLEAYLFTDGRATVRIRTTTLRGKTAYRAGARLHAFAGKVPSACEPLPCTDPIGRTAGHTYGGMAFDLRGNGWAEYYALNLSDPQPAGTNPNSVRSVTGCLYPNPGEPDASSDPADHPKGCSDDSGGPYAAVRTAGYSANLATQASYAGVTARNYVWTGARGRHYIGFQALSAGQVPGRALAYGLWFRYLP